MTVFDPVAVTRAETSGPKDIDGMVAKLEKEYGKTLPLASLALIFTLTSDTVARGGFGGGGEHSFRGGGGGYGCCSSSSGNAGGMSYEYLSGVFYPASYNSEGGISYQVVQAPLGATVSTLPQGVKANKVNGAAYYNYGTTWFCAYYSGSQTVYMVVGNPLV